MRGPGRSRTRLEDRTDSRPWVRSWRRTWAIRETSGDRGTAQAATLTICIFALFAADWRVLAVGGAPSKMVVNEPVVEDRWPQCEARVVRQAPTAPADTRLPAPHHDGKMNAFMPLDALKPFKAHLKALREAAGYTQEELATPGPHAARFELPSFDR